MEGYFTVAEYATLVGVSKDTAWHRVLRGSVPSIKDEAGYRWVYYTDNMPLPDGYVRLRPWCKEHNIPYTTMLSRLKHGKIQEPDIIRKHTTKKKDELYIRRDYRYVACYLGERIIQKQKPDGYLTQKEFSELHRIKYSTVRKLVERSKIPSIRIGQNLYISGDMPKPDIRSYRRINNEF